MSYITTEKWEEGLIKLIWEFILEIWTKNNEELNGIRKE
jgi:hypothetical protein